MGELYFTNSGEWVRFHGGKAYVGLTGRGLESDVVYIELPDEDRKVSRGEPCARVEAMKSAYDVHSPATGTVTGINDSVYDDPDSVKKSPLKTWLFCVEYEGEPETDGLLSEEEYNNTDD